MRIHPSVFLISAIVILAFIFLGVRFTEATGDAFAALQDSIVESFGWFYVLAVTFFLLFVLWLFVSPFGKVRLGKDDERPVYTNTSWFAMLFSAGMGIGLLFFGVVEPVSHFVDPPDGAPGGTLSSAEHAMKYAFLH